MNNKSISPSEHQGILAVYNSLRNEILNRINLRQKIHVFIFILAGTIVSVGSVKEIPPTIVLIYPIVAFFLAVYWTHLDVRIGDLSTFIRTEIEPHLKIKWERHIHEKILDDYPKGKLIRYFRPLEFSAFGIIVISQILSFVISFPKLTYSIVEIILIITGLLFLLFTFLIISKRRRVNYKNMESPTNKD